MSSEPPTPVYTTPELVAEALSLPDPRDPTTIYQFSNVSMPSYNQVCRFIASNEAQIDRRLKQSWKENQVKDQIIDIGRYQHDENSWRADYYLYGGYRIHLRRNILPWDPSKGDKLEVREYNNNWVDISNNLITGNMTPNTFVFDYEGGVLTLRTYFMNPRYVAVKITYRYGQEPDAETGEYTIPAEVERLCTLLTAVQILTTQFWAIKVGMGGDINGLKDSMVREMKEEAGAIFSSLQRPSSVYSMITR